ncbi:MAG: DNA-binding protein WhiA [Lachnospiraceae bacterium]|nr:DNA-binding protein WhiA [Lachnospiraceae bacterium]
MSFSSDVRVELAKNIPGARHCQLAELSALMHFCGQYGQDKEGKLTLGFQTENEAVVRKGFTLLKKTFNIDLGVTLDGEEKEHVLAFLGDLDAPVSPLIVKNTCCQRAYLRGAFLCAGSMSDPEKGYHLEFVCAREPQAMQLQEIIKGFGIEAKIVLRKKYYVVYLKEGSSIVDLLGVMEAHISLMNFENLRILKEMRNSINRKVNCETANIAKTVNAASKQVEDIIILRDFYGLHNLQPSLREIAEVRLEYPEATLKELGEMLDPPVGKSGVNHRLRKLSELASKIKA